jgi:hypothetical protein
VTSVGRFLHIVNNDLLTDLDGLSGVTSVAEELYVAGNDVLADLEGLSGVTSVGGGLQIVDNDALADLHGLSGVTSAVGGLEIEGNAALADLDGLSGVTSVGGDLWVALNAVLGNCSGIAGLLRSGGVAGTVTIEDNAPGCNSIEEVLASAPTPEEQFEDLADMVQDLFDADVLNRGQANSVQSKLDGAAAAFERGSTRAAINKLGAFINAVRALVRSRRLEPEVGDNLIEAAQALIDSISP